MNNQIALTAEQLEVFEKVVKSVEIIWDKVKEVVLRLSDAVINYLHERIDDVVYYGSLHVLEECLKEHGTLESVKWSHSDV